MLDFARTSLLEDDDATAQKKCALHGLLLSYKKLVDSVVPVTNHASTNADCVSKGCETAFDCDDDFGLRGSSAHSTWRQENAIESKTLTFAEKTVFKQQHKCARFVCVRKAEFLRTNSASNKPEEYVSYDAQLAGEAENSDVSMQLRFSALPAVSFADDAKMTLDFQATGENNKCTHGQIGDELSGSAYIYSGSCSQACLENPECRFSAHKSAESSSSCFLYSNFQ